MKFGGSQSFDGGGKINNWRRLPPASPCAWWTSCRTATCSSRTARTTRLRENRKWCSAARCGEDVAANNTVFSYNVADASIKFIGKGTISDNQRKGWLHKIGEGDAVLKWRGRESPSSNPFKHQQTDWRLTHGDTQSYIVAMGTQLRCIAARRRALGAGSIAHNRFPCGHASIVFCLHVVCSCQHGGISIWKQWTLKSSDGLCWRSFLSGWG